MIISHEHKFIFIHIPKTGGASMTQTVAKNYPDSLIWSNNPAFGDPPPFLKTHEKTVNVKKYLLRDNLNWGEYFKFCTVRNPWARAVSYYFFQFKNQMKFNDFIKEKKDVQSNWITDGIDGEIMVDYVMKLENLQEDFDTVCDKIGIPHQQLPHKNKSSHKHYTEYYDDETREIVAQKYAQDIERFGYEFGE